MMRAPTVAGQPMTLMQSSLTGQRSRCRSLQFFSRTVSLYTVPSLGGACHSLSPFLSLEALPGVLPERPEILRNPPPQVDVQSGHELQLGVDAEGPGSLTYQWFHNGHPLQYGTGPELRFPHANAAQQGDYMCRVSSNCGDSVLSDVSQVRGRFTSVFCECIPCDLCRITANYSAGVGAVHQPTCA